MSKFDEAKKEVKAWPTWKKVAVVGGALVLFALLIYLGVDPADNFAKLNP